VVAPPPPECVAHVYNLWDDLCGRQLKAGASICQSVTRSREVIFSPRLPTASQSSLTRNRTSAVYRKRSLHGARVNSRSSYMRTESIVRSKGRNGNNYSQKISTASTFYFLKVHLIIISSSVNFTR